MSAKVTKRRFEVAAFVQLVHFVLAQIFAFAVGTRWSCKLHVLDDFGTCSWSIMKTIPIASSIRRAVAAPLMHLPIVLTPMATTANAVNLALDCFGSLAVTSIVEHNTTIKIILGSAKTEYTIPV
jgi:hypothetical protein